MSSAVTYPVQVLREHLTVLAAASTACLADPGPKPVHQLRTETRRVEALLLLLAPVRGMPEHRKQAAVLLRSIAKLRRAAGEVRDFDVHHKMLEASTATPDPNAQKAARATLAGERQDQPLHNTRTSRLGDERVGGTAEPDEGLDLHHIAKELRKAASDLQRRMGAKREKAAVALQKLLRKKQIQSARSAQGLMDVLEPARDMPLRAQDVLHCAESVLARDGLLKPDKNAALTEKQLHNVRKAAKSGRYIAESVENDPVLAEAASRFKALQDAGGEWHDALQLAKAARRCLGKRNALTAFYCQERDRKLESFRAALAARSLANQRTESRKPVKGAASKRKVAA